ncbi:MAG: PHP domain-containing protein [Bacillota bacterium]|jgi:predicted metal-dependent phosphoesterase TrpH
MARKREFRVDLHIHSMFSGESMAGPKDIVESALEKGLDAICITEHESLRASAPFDTIPNHGLVILRGVELSTDMGHMLVYGVSDEDWRDWGKNRMSNAKELISRAQRLGGIVVPAHPFTIVTKCVYDSEPEILIHEETLGLEGIAAIEVCNGKYLKYPSACKAVGAAAKRLGLPGTGGSDAHTPEDVGCAFTVFRTPIYSLKSLTSAILSGQFHPETV